MTRKTAMTAKAKSTTGATSQTAKTTKATAPKEKAKKPIPPKDSVNSPDKNLAEYVAAAGAGAWVPRHFTIKRRRKSWQPKRIR